MVDDDGDSRGALVDFLENEGYFAAGAEHGARGLSLLEEGFDPDLILTDLMMPVMSGWDFCEELKKTPAWRSIPVIVLCGMAAEQRGKLQVDDAFEKPTDVRLLLSRIAELCGV
ncbi:MAG TPA: response regulator [Polyangiaceae bacterium]|nr:response regulator [Polyangiaceae bacterium]